MGADGSAAADWRAGVPAVIVCGTAVSSCGTPVGRGGRGPRQGRPARRDSLRPLPRMSSWATSGAMSCTSSTGTSCESPDSPPHSSARSAWTLVCASDSTPRTSETFYDAPSTSTAASTAKPSKPSSTWRSRPPRNPPRDDDHCSDDCFRSRRMAHRHGGRGDLTQVRTHHGPRGISHDVPGARCMELHCSTMEG